MPSEPRWSTYCLLPVSTSFGHAVGVSSDQVLGQVSNDVQSFEVKAADAQQAPIICGR